MRFGLNADIGWHREQSSLAEPNRSHAADASASGSGDPGVSSLYFARGSGEFLECIGDAQQEWAFRPSRKVGSLPAAILCLGYEGLDAHYRFPIHTSDNCCTNARTHRGMRPSTIWGNLCSPGNDAG
jgi:hypothetical protein